jgi:hypothetical protein
MSTKMKAALDYFEPLVQEIDRVLTAFQESDLQPENKVFLVDLVARLRKGWDVLGNQIVMTSHCLKCQDTGTLSVTTSPATKCPDCSVGVSVDEQFAEIDKNRQWVADRLLEKEWTCQTCRRVNEPGCSRCPGCATWRT